MKAIVKGVAVEGTPEEIAALIKATKRPSSLAERVAKARTGRKGPRELTHDEQKEYDRIVRLLDGVRARTPNFNITSLAHVCSGGMRFC